MTRSKYAIATAEVFLIFLAVLFMALFMRNVQPTQYEPAHTAQQIVTWYAGQRVLGLWGFLIAMPLTVLITGCATLLRRWGNDVALRDAVRNTFATIRAHLATAVIAVATVAAGGILAIVALHVLSD